MQEDWKLFTKKLSDVFMEVAVKDVQELRKMRNVSTDNGLIPIFKLLSKNVNLKFESKSQPELKNMYIAKRCYQRT